VKKNLLQIVRPRAKYATEVVQLPPTMAQKRIIAKNAKNSYQGSRIGARGQIFLFSAKRTVICGNFYRNRCIQCGSDRNVPVPQNKLTLQRIYLL